MEAAEIQVAWSRLEPWRNKHELAAHYGFSVRWVEARLAEGLPSVLIGGQRRFRLSETDRYLLGAGAPDIGADGRPGAD